VPPTAGPDQLATSYGLLQGRVEDGLRVFRGVPFAAPPVGALRWAPPAAPTCVDGVIDATTFGPVCPQYDVRSDDDPVPIIGDEDCLRLNIWAPVDAVAAPVFFWIHGGGHQQGAGSEAYYDGARLASRFSVVVVTINYRLGPLGFLALDAGGGADAPDGTAGTRDQIAALEWVRTHAEALGGDPARVAIAGESAGAISVCRLLATPASAGLFSSAVMQSGACVATAREEAEERGSALLADAGCAAAADPVACLRDAPATDLIGLTDPLVNLLGGVRTWDGVIDGDVLPEHPSDRIAAGAHHAVPMIIGSTTEELGAAVGPVPDQEAYDQQMSLYFGVYLGSTGVTRVKAAYPPADFGGSYRDALVAALSDAQFGCPGRRAALAIAAAQSAPVHTYRFGDVPDNAPLLLRLQGATHGLDVIYTFATVEDAPYETTEGDDAAVAAMQLAWTTLAAGADPGATVAGWGPVDADRAPTVLIDGGAALVADPLAERCAFWASLLGS
jgi:para-nitrobenzyl esterase